VVAAAGSLVEARMIDHAKDSGSFTITDLGRIAAKFYIHHRSIEIFNKVLRPHMIEEGVLSMVSLSTEVSGFHRAILRDMCDHLNYLQFDQIQVRDNETKELTSLLEQAPYEVEVSRMAVQVLSLTLFYTGCIRKQFRQGPCQWREFSEQERKNC
jgi:antiviral helicase SLH1